MSLPKSSTAVGLHCFRQDAITVQEVKDVVCDAFRVRPIEMISARRSREVARPRQVAMYLARELTPYSLPHIGRMFGNRDHTTVIHALRQIERLMGEDDEFRTKVESARDDIVSTERQQSVDKSIDEALATAA